MEAVLDKLLTFANEHRLPDDPFFTEGDGICKATVRLGVYDIDDEELCHEGTEEFSCQVPSCNAVFESLMSFEIHYNSLHRYSCSVCKKQLPSPYFLDLHVAETHDSFFKVQAERKPMYQCFVEACAERFSVPEIRRDHCISVHKFPHNFRFDDSWKHKGAGKKSKKETQISSAAVDIDMEQPKTTKKSGKELVLGKGKRGGKMWHTAMRSEHSTSFDVEFDSVVKELRENLPDEMS